MVFLIDHLYTCILGNAVQNLKEMRKWINLIEIRTLIIATMNECMIQKYVINMKYVKIMSWAIETISLKLEHLLLAYINEC